MTVPSTSRRPARDPRSRHGGQATVELVLVLPVVVLALLLVLQVGLVARAQVVAVDAAREGARAAAVEGTRVAAVAAARTAVGPAAADRLQVDVDLEPAPGGYATVRVRYRVPTDVAIVGPLLRDPVTTATVAMRREDPDVPP